MVLGIDGGQSSTVAVLVDETGELLGRGTAGPSDHVGEPATSERAAVACELAAARALSAAGLEAGVAIEAVVLGMSGFEGRWHGREPVFAAARVRYVHDAPIALAGAVDRRPGGVVIAGTGSVGYGEGEDGAPVQVGGYGYLFGDEGSGFAIARGALAAAMRAADEGVTTDLGAAAKAFFDVPNLRALARAVSLNEIDRPHVAGFARVVLDAARLGDAHARTLIEDAATALASLANAVATRLAHSGTTAVPIAFVGGIAQHPLVLAAIRGRLETGTPVSIVPAAAEPALGAALLAFDDARIPRPNVAAARA